MRKRLVFLAILIGSITLFACNNTNPNTPTGGDSGTDKGSEEKKVVNIGDKGPGDGLVFYIDIDTGEAWEVSGDLGIATWEEAKTICKNHRGGGFSDWYLPNKEELNWVYENLVISKKIEDDKCYWSSYSNAKSTAWFQYFNDGKGVHNFRDFPGVSVRAVRIFKISQ